MACQTPEHAKEQFLNQQQFNQSFSADLEPNINGPITGQLPMFDEEPIVPNLDLGGSLESDDGHSLLANIKEKTKSGKNIAYVGNFNNFKRSQQMMIMSFKESSPTKLRNLSEDRFMTHQSSGSFGANEE